MRRISWFGLLLALVMLCGCGNNAALEHQLSEKDAVIAELQEEIDTQKTEDEEEMDSSVSVTTEASDEFAPLIGFLVETSDVIMGMDNICFAESFEEGLDPHLLDNYTMTENGWYSCNPSPLLHLIFATDSNGVLTSISFQYDSSEGASIEFTYFQDYIFSFLRTLYTENEAERIYSELGVTSMPLTILYGKHVEINGVKWFLFSDGNGITFFQSVTVDKQ